MIITKRELSGITRCVSNAGIKLWLKLSGVPFAENRNGDPFVNEQHEHLLDPSADHIEKLLSNSRSFKRDEPGVYLLKRKGEVVYIGMTQSLFGRMDKHVRGDIRFDEIVFVSAEPADINSLETELIARYAPKHNIAKNVLQK